MQATAGRVTPRQLSTSSSSGSSSSWEPDDPEPEPDDPEPDDPDPDDPDPDPDPDDPDDPDGAVVAVVTDDPDGCDVAVVGVLAVTGTPSSSTSSSTSSTLASTSSSVSTSAPEPDEVEPFDPEPLVVTSVYAAPASRTRVADSNPTTTVVVGLVVGAVVGVVVEVGVPTVVGATDLLAAATPAGPSAGSMPGFCQTDWESRYPVGNSRSRNANADPPTARRYASSTASSPSRMARERR